MEICLVGRSGKHLAQKRSAPSRQLSLPIGSTPFLECRTGIPPPPQSSLYRMQARILPVVEQGRRSDRESKQRDFNKVWRRDSFPLRMRSSPSTRARRLRLEAAEGPRIDLSGPTRREKDLLGERDVPAGALYGIQTLRAIENFCVSGIELHEFPTLVAGLATVKEAAALANLEMKLIDREIVDAISQAAGEIRDGMHHEHFRVDMIQGGAGTSSNMNTNEVMANRALEILGRERGDYDVVHPNNHLNLSQSTNDVYPTAVKLALHTSISDLQLAMIALAASFLHKGEEFSSFIKMGRTQLQDAVPMTLGQEFNAFAHTMLEDVDRLGEAQALIREINMGATAIGTGINAPPGYAESVRRHLEHITGL